MRQREASVRGDDAEAAVQRCRAQRRGAAMRVIAGRVTRRGAGSSVREARQQEAQRRDSSAARSTALSTVMCQAQRQPMRRLLRDGDAASAPDA